MITHSVFYDAILYIYALSLLFYFSDFARASRSAKRMGAGLLLFVWVLQTVYLVTSALKHLNNVSMFETLLLFSWLIITVSFIVSRFVRIELFVFLVNVVGFGILAINFFSNPAVKPSLANWKMSDELLFMHITLALASYVAFTASAVFSGMYIFVHRKLKTKDWSATMKRMPALYNAEKYMHKCVIIGFPLLLLALALGIAWITIEGDATLFYDVKVIFSLSLLLVYAGYLFLNYGIKLPGIRLAKWNLAAFAIVVLNFVVTNGISTFHGWK
ncbi:cytochrome c biogenesis protein [Paenibacillus sp. N1-5-1-14]|uniref:cytochrome C assembly family protein n=1 Tax=Paenibacillus radicibacter TaxID=2972488 RepID=UPI002158D885|nr:cytochrome c biogenesis protein [Paenibacillus radicibacter]MCR8644178.1 cytochrome c biogenesis protein [Paenibacillus radicibacter]